MNFFKKIQGGIYNGIGFILVLGITGVAYGAYVSLSDVTSGSVLTSTTFNQVLENQRTMKTTLDGLSNVPAGAVMAFNLSSCPTGWIAANGSNGTPDLRGEFIRGLDSGRGVDSGRTLGSSQISTQILVDNDANEVLGAIDYTNNNITSLGYEASQISASTSVIYHRNLATSNGNLNNSLIRSLRPRNVALLYCVKQ